MTAILPCCHHWLCEPPRGPFSLGTCRQCGEVREFSNQAPDERDMHDQGHASYANSRAAARARGVYASHKTRGVKA